MNTKTKKKLIIILSSVCGAVLFLAIALAACAGMTMKAPSEEESLTGTLEISTQLSPSSPETDAASAESTSESPTETDPQPTQTEPIETEGETESPLPSLSFSSNGNGTCSVSGIGTVTDSYVSIPLQSPNGEVVTAIDEKAFFGNKFIKAVDIPSTVFDIGDMAFADCPELIYVSVNDTNKSFMDIGGILYSADGSRLIAYPAASGASSISIPASVKIIAPMAFYGCNNLKLISFEGTVEEWSGISKGDMNYGLYYTSIVCSDTEK